MYRKNGFMSRCLNIQALYFYFGAYITLSLTDLKEINMNKWKQIMEQQTFRYIDHTEKKTFDRKPYTAMTSFALDDALALAISNRLSPPALRTWVHDKTIVLGIPDGRLPF